MWTTLWFMGCGGRTSPPNSRRRTSAAAGVSLPRQRDHPRTGGPHGVGFGSTAILPWPPGDVYFIDAGQAIADFASLKPWVASTQPHSTCRCVPSPKLPGSHGSIRMVRHRLSTARSTSPGPRATAFDSTPTTDQLFVDGQLVVDSDGLTCASVEGRSSSRPVLMPCVSSTSRGHVCTCPGGGMRKAMAHLRLSIRPGAPWPR